MKKILLFLFAFICLTSSADTIYVEKAFIESPLELFKPYQTDSIDTKQKKFSSKDYLLDNISLVKRAKDIYSFKEIGRGERLAIPSFGKINLNLIHFYIDTKKFEKVNLDIKGLNHYKVYQDGIEVVNGNLQLTPGRHKVSMICQTEENGKDSFNVKIIGADAADLVLNSKECRNYDMKDMLLGNHYHSAQLSPSGKYLVIVYYTKQEDGSNLFKTVLLETTTQRLIFSKNEYMGCAWLPLRDMLYFTRKGNGGRQLVTFNPVDGIETIIGENIPEGNFTISPKEDYLIYTKGQEGSKPTNSLKRLENPDDRQPGWRNRTTLYRYDLATGQMQRLTFGNTSIALNDISKDAKYLLLSYSKLCPQDKPFSRTTILRMDAYTGKVDTLIADTAYIASALFSPDAKKLLIKASPAAFEGIGMEVKDGQIPNAFDYRLYAFSLENDTTEPLLCGFDPTVGKTLWSTADNNIYFLATDGCNESLFCLDFKTKKVMKYQLPVSYIQGFTISTVGKQPQVVFWGQTGERARDMYLCSLSTEKPKVKKIGEIDFDNLYKDVNIGACKDWSFLSSRGDSIRGFYFLPPNFDSSKKYPMIVYYYGGCVPTGKALEFQYPLQVFASLGYVVYVVEPSGATGFGQEFAARHVNTWGIDSADDIIEGTKAFVASHPFVDSKKVGCMGASYGGFMTQYLQTRTDIFAAAVSHAGISNIASYWGGGYWGYTYGEVAQYGSYPWNNPELYVKQSPLFNAEKINTPILLLHGTVDTNVPTNESQQLFTALRILGKPVSYIEIAGENHVVVDYKKRLAWQNSIFAWFAYWLKGEPLWWQTLYPNDNFGKR